MENYDIELRGDLLDEYKAIQAAEEGNEPKLIPQEEMQELVRDIFEELSSYEEKPEEYTEEDAFRDFIMDQKEDFDG